MEEKTAARVRMGRLACDVAVEEMCAAASAEGGDR